MAWRNHDGVSALTIARSDRTALAFDGTPPVIGCVATPSTLDSASAALVPVHVALTSTDATSGVASLVLTGIASDVPLTTDDQQGFSVGAASTDGALRAGPGPRNYSLTYTAVDVAGNSATCTAVVHLPEPVVDSTLPRCTLLGITLSGGRRVLSFGVSDGESGLAQVRVISAQGAAVSLPTVTRGSTPTHP